MNPLRASLIAAVCCLLGLGTTTAQAQVPSNGRLFLQNQNMPPGQAGAWAAVAGKASPCWYQPVLIQLPNGGNVTVYSRSFPQPATFAAPAPFGLIVGPVYRLKLSNMPEYPGVELFPSIELIDRLHPPVGQAFEFAVPIQFTQEEIDLVLEGRLITKVLYLEQPQIVPARHLDNPARIDVLTARQDALLEADLLGRPIALVRLGGRVPDMLTPDPGFFGTGAPVLLPPQPPANARPALPEQASVPVQQTTFDTTAVRAALR